MKIDEPKIVKWILCNRCRKPWKSLDVRHRRTCPRCTNSVERHGSNRMVSATTVLRSTRTRRKD